MKRFVVLIAAALAASTVAGACGAISPYAAKVNSARISQDALDGELDAIRSNEKFVEALQSGAQPQAVSGVSEDTFDMAFVTFVLQRRIVFELVHQEFERRKLRIDASDVQAARADAKQGFATSADPDLFDQFPRSYQTEVVRTNAEILALQESLAGGAASPAAVRKFYDANQKDFEETCVSHILVDTKEKAAELKARIDKGADFGEIAKAESKDNAGGTGGSAADGGALGCLTTSESQRFAADFVAGYANLTPGQVSEPVQTQFGFHLIKITERRQRSLDQAGAEIRERLSQNAQSDLQELLFRRLRTAKIRVNPRYGRFDKEQLRVVAPLAPQSSTTVPALPGTPPG